MTTRAFALATVLLGLPSLTLAEEPGEDPALPPGEDSAPPLEPVAETGGKLFGLFSVDVRAGTIFRAFRDIGVSGSGYSNGLSSYPRLLGRSSSSLPAGVGTTASSTHNYSDGYNRPSAPTPATGLTWFWGYQNPSQVSGNSLSFHATGGSATIVSATDAHTVGTSNDDDPDSFGTYLETNLLVDIPDTRLSVGPQFAFSWNGFDSSSSTSTFRRSIFRQNQSVAVTDTYSLGGIIAPAAPYSGGSTGPGPVILNTPASRSVSNANTGTDSAILWNQIDHKIDLDVYTFSFGAHASWDVGPASVFASAGATLNVVDIEAQRRETLYSRTNKGKRAEVREWNDRLQDTDVLWGTYFQAGAAINCPHGWTVGGFIRYDWTQSLSGQVGPSAIDVDLDSLSAGIFAGFTF